VEVFGEAGEPESLRRAFLAQDTPPAAMPESQAAIPAVRALVPSTADLSSSASPCTNGGG